LDWRLIAPQGLRRSTHGRNEPHHEDDQADRQPKDGGRLLARQRCRANFGESSEEGKSEPQRITKSVE
jgi:hypothetical protein